MSSPLHNLLNLFVLNLVLPLESSFRELSNGVCYRFKSDLQMGRYTLIFVVERVKAFVDRHHTPRTFQECSYKLLQALLHSSLIVGQKPKLSPRFCGPCTIIKKISDVAYKLQLPDDYKIHPIFHVSKLRPYISRDENCVDGIVALGDRISRQDVPFRVLDKRE
ncbi:hypothetical protein KP509_01G022500 [Ceratopteris richardii]|uniref:Tf2-1-like SH3-like domain-containing protein n=1 Tax=Ceratopteris richardii TaxID=49495 RepID=A0A8T2VMS8_CERRI|nr:hypothetical protein KP509_01G022500 [Ceratopteris richardii]